MYDLKKSFFNNIFTMKMIKKVNFLWLKYIFWHFKFISEFLKNFWTVSLLTAAQKLFWIMMTQCDSLKQLLFKKKKVT